MKIKSNAFKLKVTKGMHFWSKSFDFCILQESGKRVQKAKNPALLLEFPIPPNEHNIQNKPKMLTRNRLKSTDFFFSSKNVLEENRKQH